MGYILINNQTSFTMVFITDVDSFKGSELLNNFAGFNYSDIIELKEDYKNALLSTGIGFDGNINYNICFKAIFDETPVSGSVLFRVNGLFDNIADLKYNLTQDGNYTNMNIALNSTWNIDLTNPTVYSTEDTLKYCGAEKGTSGITDSYGIYDPLWACSPGSDHIEACYIMSRAASGFNAGDWVTGVTFGSEQSSIEVAAPKIKDYYFKTSQDTWVSALLYGLKTGDTYEEPIACAKFYPVNCTSEEILPFNSEIQEKLLALGVKGQEKSTLLQSLINSLTLGATAPLFGGLSGATSTDDLKQLLLESLTGEDMLSFSDKIDPALLADKDWDSLFTGDLSSLLSLLNKEDKDVDTIDLSALLSFLSKDEDKETNLLAKLNPLNGLAQILAKLGSD